MKRYRSDQRNKWEERGGEKENKNQIKKKKKTITNGKQK